MSSRRVSSNNDFIPGLFVIVGALFLLVVAFSYPLSQWFLVDHPEGKIVDVYVKDAKGHGNYYAVLEYNDGHREVFQNKDAGLRFKFNSSDHDQALKKLLASGKTVRLTVVGVRFPLLSWYRNITREKVLQI